MYHFLFFHSRDRVIPQYTAHPIYNVENDQNVGNIQQPDMATEAAAEPTASHEQLNNDDGKLTTFLPQRFPLAYSNTNTLHFIMQRRHIWFEMFCMKF